MVSKVVSMGTSCLRRWAGGDGMLGDEDNPLEKPERHDSSKHRTPKAAYAYRLPARDKIGRGIGLWLPRMMQRGSMTPQWKTSACLNTKQTRCRSTAWKTRTLLLSLRIQDKDQNPTLTTSPMRKTGPRLAPPHYDKPHIRSMAA